MVEGKMNIEPGAESAFLFVHPTEAYADEIGQYRREFLDAGDHMDGCGPLRAYDDPKEYIAVCTKRSRLDSNEAPGGRAQQFLLVRQADHRLVGMAQYRYDADPRFRIGYSVRPGERGKGYAKTVLRSLLAWLNAQGKAVAVIAREASNEASRRVILACGGKEKEKCTYKGIDLLVFEIALTGKVKTDAEMPAAEDTLRSTNGGGSNETV